MVRAFIVAFGLALAGCESSSTKAERLRQDVDASALLVRYYRTQVDAAKTGRARDSLKRLLVESQATHDAAVRELNGFLSGR